MIANFELTGGKVGLDNRLKKYIDKKLANLDRYMSRHIRPSAQMEVRLDERKADGQQQSVCNVTLRLPRQTIRVSEAALNIYAAIDIVEVKLKQQLKKYKDERTDGKLRRRLASRWRRSAPPLES